MSITSEIRLRVRKEGDVVLNQLSAKLNDLAQRSVLSNNKFKDLANTLKASDAQIRTKSIQGLQDYARAWRELANNVDITSKEFRQATQEAQRFEREVAKAQGRRAGGGRLAGIAQTTGAIAASGIFGGPEGFLGAGIGALAGGPAGAAVGGAIGAQVGMFRQQLGGTATYAAEISKQRQALQLVTKDVGEYQRALSFIDRTSRDLAIPQEILTRQFTQLTASVKGAGGNVRDAEKAFIGVASGIRGTGGSLEQLDSALTATSQVFSKGKVSAEELRQQIGERLPGAFSLFAESIGMTPQELDKALEKGQVSLQDFQKFSEKLFAEYGENAKIIADGPDAAGDRLRTALSRLSESVGTLLKPIGAEFQTVFARIVISIDEAAKKLASFLGLGKGRAGEIAKLERDIATTDTRLQAFARLRMQRGGMLGPVEFGQEKTLTKRNIQLRSQLSALKAAEKVAQQGQAEPPSKLPGILPDKSSTENEAKKLAQVAQQTFNKTLQQLGITLGLKERDSLVKKLSDIEADKLAAIQKGNTQELKRLELASRRVTLDVEETALLTEREKLEGLITQGKAKGVDISNAANKLAVVNVAFKENQLNQQKQINAELLLEKAIAEEYYSQFAYGGDVTQIPTVFSAFKDQIKSLREEIADTFPEMMQLADGLSASFGTAFGNLVFSAKSARETMAQFFADIAQSFQNMVVQMINDYLRLQIISFFKNLFAPQPVSLLGNFFGGGGASTFTNPSFGVDTSGLAGPLKPFGLGGIMTNNGALPLKRYAAGGIASSPQLAMFGEGSRPEAYVPLPDGRTIPVTMKNGGQMGNIVVNVDAGGTSVQGNEPEANKLGEVIGIAIRQELIKQKRPGGLLS